MIVLGGLSLFFFWSPKNKPVLRILSYSSFFGVHGPGRVIKQKFESVCECKLIWFSAEDSSSLFKNFSLIPDIDLVIGWDQITLQNAGLANDWQNLKSFQPLVEKPSLITEDLFLKNPYFLPFNWSPVGFIYKEGTKPVTALKSLYNIEGKITFPEPSSSSLGLEFYYWIYELFKGDKQKIKNFLSRLKNKVYGPVFSWSLAYGFFQKQKSSLGLSYLSSLIYHEKNPNLGKYFFATFKEGHPYQIEFLSLARDSKNKDLAFYFIRFLLSAEIQKIIKNKHYMFPLTQELSFHYLLNNKDLKFISYKRREGFINQKKELLKLWKQSLY